MTPAAPSSSALAAAADRYADAVVRDEVRVTGPDATSFLDGQLSQAVADLEVGASAWSFVLQPQGKVDAWCRVWRRGPDAFGLDVDAGFGELLEARLRRFFLRVDATIEVELARPPILHDPDAARTAWRVERGIPAMGAEITDAVIPAELGQWVVDSSVSFTKGCFTGQELVARVDSRGGNVPRPLRGLVADGPMAPGDLVERDGEPVGHVTSAAATSALRRAVALAFVHRTVEPGAVLAVRGETIVDAEVTALPLVAVAPPQG